MAHPTVVSVLAALVLSLSTASSLNSRLVITHRPASHCRALAPLLLLDDGAEEEEEAPWPRDEEEDLDTAFQRLRLEGLASEWWSELRLEALEGLPVTNDGHERGWQQRFARDLASASVAFLVFLSVLKLYLLQTGGGLVIVPMGEGGLVNVYNFDELKHLEPSHLLKLGIPAATPISVRYGFCSCTATNGSAPVAMTENTGVVIKSINGAKYHGGGRYNAPRNHCGICQWSTVIQRT